MGNFCKNIPIELERLQKTGTNFDIMLGCKAGELALLECFKLNQDMIFMKNPPRAQYISYFKLIDQSLLPQVDSTSSKSHLISDAEKEAIMKSLSPGQVLPDNKEVSYKKAIAGIKNDSERVKSVLRTLRTESFEADNFPRRVERQPLAHNKPKFAWQ
jgi:hypothetical protein